MGLKNPTNDSLDEETSEFFNNCWSQRKLITPFFDEFVAGDLFEHIMPACNGTLEIFWKDGKHFTAKVSGGKIILKNKNGWVPIFSICKTEETVA